MVRIRAALSVAIAVLAGGPLGCGQILGIEDVTPGADTDAGSAADADLSEPPPDGDPNAPPDASAEVSIDVVEPATIDEGAGAIRPIPIVVYGRDLSQDLEVITAGIDVQVSEVAVSTLGDVMAFSLSVPVITDLRAEDAPISLSVRVQQAGASSNQRAIAVRGLNEFRASLDAPSGRLNSDAVLPRYSRVVIDRPLTLEGPDPVRLVANAEMRVQEQLSADGFDGAGSTSAQPGAGGCGGGPTGQDAPCGLGGGATGAVTSGAGGGGHRTPGGAGAGSAGGSGGASTGSADLIPLGNEGGNGGGGTDAAGGGGGGGGVIEVTSEGRFIVEAQASFSADGGDGRNPLCSQTTDGGSGGGSGGAILLRGFSGFEVDVTGTRVSVQGGRGGSSGCVADGGDGGDGRVRVDHNEAEPPAFVRNVEHVRGAMISPELAPIVRRESEAVLVTGPPGGDYEIHLNGELVGTGITIGDSGTYAVPVAFAIGLNRLCIASSDLPIDTQPREAYHCLSVAYIPTEIAPAAARQR